MKRKKEKKGQMSLELIIISIAVFSLFLSMFAVIDYRNKEIISIKQLFDSKDIGDQVAWNINQVYISGFGANSFVYIPETTTDNTNINITIYPSLRIVHVSWGSRFYTAPLLTSRITDNISGISNYNFTLIPGRLNITNIRGEIHLTQ